jgi:hypothetical protein
MKHLTNVIKQFALFAICMCALGCNTRIEYAIKNNSNVTLHDIIVTINNEHYFTHGTLKPGIHFSYSGPMQKFTSETMTIMWKDEFGKNATNIVKVSRRELTDKRVIVICIDHNMKIEKQWRWP